MKYLLSIILGCTLLISSNINRSLSDEIVQRLDLKDNKLYILDFFASWCVSCDKEAPKLNNLSSQLDFNKVEIIGIDVDESLQDGLIFQKKHQINFRVVNDANNNIVSKFAPAGMPALYYIQNNKIIYTHIGAIKNIDKKILHDLQNLQVFGKLR